MLKNKTICLYKPTQHPSVNKSMVKYKEQNSKFMENLSITDCG